jgi:hypothetical protein
MYVVPHSTSEPEHTEAYTRRNSLIELEDSHYFVSVTHNLHGVDPVMDMAVLSCHSHYFNYQEVEVRGWDHVVPETSPQRLHFTSQVWLNVL